MNLKILLPFRIFDEISGVKHIVLVTNMGSFGILPHRLDCTAALVPGILTYETEAEGEKFVAIDKGIMIKTGSQVLVSVRNAVGGADLGKLREAVENEFINLEKNEKNIRTVIAKLESDFMYRLKKLRNK
jgi:F-type H+-transporting ATPase subunit epsilon